MAEWLQPTSYSCAAVFSMFLVFIRCSLGEESNLSFSAMYLTKYGYMGGVASNPNVSALVSEEAFDQGIKDFQAFAGLEVTGKLDNDTRYMMSLPRCGVRDRVGHGATARRRKRYALQGSRWRTKDLTFNIVKYPARKHGFTTSQVDSTIQKALNVWSEYTDLTFTRKKSGDVHIEIQFVSGEHGDGDPFDGKGGTLAHAFFPVYGGDAHFDDQERWTVNSRWGTDLFQVAAHEFGHSLGLSHSDIKNSLMAPFYRGYTPDFELHQDDIRGIQKLYGKKTKRSNGGGNPTTEAPRKTTRPPRKPVSDEVLCGGSNRIDGITTDPDKNTYVFKGSKYWLLTDTGVAAGYPKSIKSDWQGVPDNIDAVFTWKNGKIFFFKGDKYYRVENKRVDSGYPKRISQGFAGIPDDVDTAFVWSGNGMIYFFKGTKYYRFDPTNKPPVKSVYPKQVSAWEGLPNYIDAALQYTNDYTYFFKGDDYYRFNDRYFSVDDSSDPYPRSAAKWWFGCDSSQNIEHDNGGGAFNSIDNNNIDAGPGCPYGDFILNLPSKGLARSLQPCISLIKSALTMLLIVFLW